MRLCTAYRVWKYALAVQLPPVSRPSSPPSALASGTGWVWSSQLIRQRAGTRCGPRGLSRHNKINSQAHDGHRASRSADVASAFAPAFPENFVLRELTSDKDDICLLYLVELLQTNKSLTRAIFSRRGRESQVYVLIIVAFISLLFLKDMILYND